MSSSNSSARSKTKRESLKRETRSIAQEARSPKPTGKRVAAPTRSEKPASVRARARGTGEVAAARPKSKAAARSARPSSTRRGSSAVKTAASATRTRRKTVVASASRTTGRAPATDTAAISASSPSVPAAPVNPEAPANPKLQPVASREAPVEHRMERPLPAPQPEARRPRFRLGTFDDLIAPYPSQVQTLCLALRGLISRVIPGARETIITGMQLALFEQDGPIGLLSPQRDHARLYFVRGNELKDHSRLLQGGSGLLFVKLWHLDTLQVPALRSLLLEAVTLNREKPDPNLTAGIFGDLAH